MHLQLMRQFPNEKLQLPPKRLIGNNFDPEFIESRREGLHAYIQKILMSPTLRSRCAPRTLGTGGVRWVLTLHGTHLDGLEPAASDAVKEFIVNEVPGKVGSVGALMEKLDINNANATNDQNAAPDKLGETAEDKSKVTLDDFNLLKVIGKGSFGKVRRARRAPPRSSSSLMAMRGSEALGAGPVQVMLARHKKSGMIYAVKVLSKKAIKQRDEVKHIMAGSSLEPGTHRRRGRPSLTNVRFCQDKAKLIRHRAECPDAERQAPIPSGPALLVPDGGASACHNRRW